MTAALPKQLVLPAPKMKPWQLKRYAKRLERELMVARMTIERLRQQRLAK